MCMPRPRVVHRRVRCSMLSATPQVNLDVARAHVTRRCRVRHRATSSERAAEGLGQREIAGMKARVVGGGGHRMAIPARRCHPSARSAHVRIKIDARASRCCPGSPVAPCHQPDRHPRNASQYRAPSSVVLAGEWCSSAATQVHAATRQPAPPVTGSRHVDRIAGADHAPPRHVRAFRRRSLQAGRGGGIGEGRDRLKTELHGAL